MQAIPADVLQEQLEQLQQQHDQFRAEVQQSMQAKDDLVQQLQREKQQLSQQPDRQVSSFRSILQPKGNLAKLLRPQTFLPATKSKVTRVLRH